MYKIIVFKIKSAYFHDNRELYLCTLLGWYLNYEELFFIILLPQSKMFLPESVD